MIIWYTCNLLSGYQMRLVNTSITSRNYNCVHVCVVRIFENDPFSATLKCIHEIVHYSHRAEQQMSRTSWSHHCKFEPFDQSLPSFLPSCPGQVPYSCVPVGLTFSPLLFKSTHRGEIQVLSFPVWLVILSIMSHVPKVLKVHPCCHKCRICFFLRWNYISHVFFNCSSVNEHSGCFHVLAVVKDTAVNVGV